LARAELRPAVFLDRDGVINEPVLDERSRKYESPYRPEDVILAEGAAEAIKKLRDAGFLLIAVSNQPAAAKATTTMDELKAVHDRVVELLGEDGAQIDDWRYCFHHPEGVVPELTTACDCRKPAPGMILDGAAHNGADLAESWMVGDSDVDIEAAQRAGIRTILVENPLTTHRRKGAGAQENVRNLSAAAGIILNESRR
jgi:D-glycero-D-manno-heptose 1,7-bisphosphate phosphatase